MTSTKTYPENIVYQVFENHQNENDRLDVEVYDNYIPSAEDLEEFGEIVTSYEPYIRRRSESYQRSIDRLVRIRKSRRKRERQAEVESRVSAFLAKDQNRSWIMKLLIVGLTWPDNKIKPSQYQVIEMMLKRYQEGFTYAEVAEDYDITGGTVSAKVAAMITRFKQSTVAKALNILIWQDVYPESECRRARRIIEDIVETEHEEKLTALMDKAGQVDGQG